MHHRCFEPDGAGNTSPQLVTVAEDSGTKWGLTELSQSLTSTEIIETQHHAQQCVESQHRESKCTPAAIRALLMATPEAKVIHRCSATGKKQDNSVTLKK